MMTTRALKFHSETLQRWMKLEVFSLNHCSNVVSVHHMRYALVNVCFVVEYNKEAGSCTRSPNQEDDVGDKYGYFANNEHVVFYYFLKGIIICEL